MMILKERPQRLATRCVPPDCEAQSVLSQGKCPGPDANHWSNRDIDSNLKTHGSYFPPRGQTHSKQMRYTKHLSDPWYTYVAQGLKTVEGRLLSGSLGMVVPGDEITFYNGVQRITLFVTRVQIYESFAAMLEAETLERVLPGVYDLDEGVNVYRQYYGPEEEAQGVIAISFTD